MVVEKLPEVITPSGRVPGRGLLMLPILEALRRRNRGENRDAGFLSRVSGRERYIGEGGQPGGPPGVQAPPRRGLGGAAPPGRLGTWWWSSGPTLALLEGSSALIFYIFFPEFFWHFK